MTTPTVTNTRYTGLRVGERVELGRYQAPPELRVRGSTADCCPDVRP